MAAVGGAAVCCVLVGTVLAGYLRGVPVFDAFTKGALEGMKGCVKLMPTLLGLIVAVTMLRASGFFTALGALFAPLTETLHLEPDLLPLMFLRPFSGSGSVSYVTELFRAHGADSEAARMAAVLASSTETTFYAVAVYFSAGGYRSLRYTVPAALCGDCCAAVLSVLSVRLFF